jgi:hypothetical protein
MKTPYFLITLSAILSLASYLSFIPSAKAGWFKDLTGIETPKPIRDLDPTRPRTGPMYEAEPGCPHCGQSTLRPSNNQPLGINRLGQKWYITEGGEWVGEWTRQGNSNTFNAFQRSNKSGQTNTFQTTVFINGNAVSIRRYNSADGNNCNYTGNIKGNSVSGNYFCNSGGPYYWQGSIQY